MRTKIREAGHMRFAIKTILSLLLLTVISCCPISQQPLSDLNKATYDKRLEGVWRITSKDGAGALIHIGRMKDNLTKVITVENNPNGDLKSAEYAMFPTVIDNMQYMNIFFDDVSKGIPKEIKGYYFARYDLKDNKTLLFYSITPKVAEDAIKSGRLKGIIKYKAAPGNGAKKTDNSPYCVTITDTSENIIKFIRESDPKVLFPATPDTLKAERVQ
jgi:hypothetical protein